MANGLGHCGSASDDGFVLGSFGVAGGSSQESEAVVFCMYCGRRGGFDDGFVWHVIFGRELVAEALEAVKIVDGAAVETLGLGLEAEKDGNDFGLAIDLVEAEGEPESSVLINGGRNVLAELGALENFGVFGREHSDVEAVGEEAGLDGGETVHGVLGDGDAFDGEALLGVDGLVGSDGVGDEGGDAGAVLNAVDGEGVGVEGALAGILGGAGLTFFGTGSGGTAGVGGPRGRPSSETFECSWHSVEI